MECGAIMEVFINFWNEYSPMVLAIGGTILTVGGMIFAAYIVVKPKIDWFKDKLQELKDNTSIDSVTEDITSKLKTTDITVKIAELEDKIANPLTSDTSRLVYIASLKAYTEMLVKLDAGIAITEDATNNL